MATFFVVAIFVFYLLDKGEVEILNNYAVSGLKLFLTTKMKSTSRPIDAFRDQAISSSDARSNCRMC